MICFKSHVDNDWVNLLCFKYYYSLNEKICFIYCIIDPGIFRFFFIYYFSLNYFDFKIFIVERPILILFDENLNLGLPFF